MKYLMVLHDKRNSTEEPFGKGRHISHERERVEDMYVCDSLT